MSDKEVYSEEALRGAFQRLFPGEAPRVARAPGRVNLIGEHTDYNGLPVLPMTLAHEVRALFSPRADTRAVLRNLRAEYAPAEFDTAGAPSPSPAGSWDNYVKAGLIGARQYAPGLPPAGLNLLVDATLPAGAGLSSSTALVVAAALAFLDAAGRAPASLRDRLRLASALAEAEHFVGTRGGGMDHAALLLGSAGQACKIDFFPLRVEHAPLPDDCAVVVCDSMVKAEKSGAAREKYNLNPRLCALACALVRRQLREDFGEDVPLERLGDLWFGPLCLTTREAENLFLAAVPEGRLALPEIARLLGLSPEAAARQYLPDVALPPEGVDLHARVTHQAAEYRRVEHARDALIANDPEAFGRLMVASHDSCRDNLGVSCPELDRLVDAALRAGALGARLTGAGFGGATVNLVWREKTFSFIEEMARACYANHPGPPPVFIAETAPPAGVGDLRG